MDYRNQRGGTTASDLEAWLHTEAGLPVRQWLERACAEQLIDVFGFHALQLGLPSLNLLQGNRMPDHWTVHDAPCPEPSPRPAVVADFHALPFEDASLDLVLMPHTLELGVDAHGVLREAGRVLRPEGQVMVLGFNPNSWWGWSRRLHRSLPGAQPRAHEHSDWVGPRRLRDWLRLLGFEVDTVHLACFGPPLDSARWRPHWQWLERTGDRWWPALGAVYAVRAVKRVPATRWVGLAPSRRGATRVPAVGLSARQHRQLRAGGPHGQ